MKYIRLIIIPGLIFLMSTQGFEADAQRRVVRKDVKVKKVSQKRVVRKYRRVPHHYYRNMPRWGYWVNVVPPEANVVVYKGTNYRYLNGVYYRPFAKNKFMVVAAPQGIRVKVLPVGYQRIVVAGRTKPYFYYYGTYYRKNVINGITYFETIKPPIGAQVDALPEGYDELEIGGEIYCVLEDDYYKEVITGQGDGDVYYELVRMSKTS